MLGFGHKEKVEDTSPAEAPVTEASQAEWNAVAKSIDSKKGVGELRIDPPREVAETTNGLEDAPVTHDLGETAVNAQQSQDPLGEWPAAASPEAPVEEKDSPSEQHTAA